MIRLQSLSAGERHRDDAWPQTSPSNARHALVRALLVAGLLTPLQAPSTQAGEARLAGALLFSDDFETGASNWIRSDSNLVAIVESHDPAHGKVMQLSPSNGQLKAVANWLLSRPPGDPVFALIKECEEGRDVLELLNGPVCDTGFKRLN